MKLFLIPLSIVVLCSCATKSIPEATKTEMDSDIKRYLNYRNQKAYAVAVEKDGAWVSGYGYGYPNQELANKRALLECEVQKQSRKIIADCFVLYEDGRRKNGI